MADVDQLMAEVRDRAASLLDRAAERLLAGAAKERIHGYYVTATVELLEEAEARALLVAGGDASAAAAIETVVRRLRVLTEELSAEPPVPRD